MVHHKISNTKWSPQQNGQTQPTPAHFPGHNCPRLGHSAWLRWVRLGSAEQGSSGLLSAGVVGSVAIDSKGLGSTGIYEA